MVAEEVGIDPQAEFTRHTARMVAMQIEARALLPVIAHAQSLEMMTNLKPVLIIPETSILSEADSAYGYVIISAKVDKPYVAFSPR